MRLVVQLVLGEVFIMKKAFTTMCLAASLVSIAAPSYAMGWFQHNSNQNQGQGGNQNGNGSTPAASNVPEIDGAGAILALALLGGVVAVARERRKKK